MKQLKNSVLRSCITPGCHNTTKVARKCGTCRSRELKKNHPHTYFFNATRNNARRRLIEFTITLDDFKEFCFETEYLNKKGRKSRGLTIDRPDPSKGYVKGNLQGLPHCENSVKKRVVYDHFADRKFSTRTITKFAPPSFPHSGPMDQKYNQHLFKNP